jgi:hypothetical protein
MHFGHHEADFWAEMRQFFRNQICLSAFDIANNAGLSEASVLHDFGKRNSRGILTRATLKPMTRTPT